jgi:hypothetical protein
MAKAPGALMTAQDEWRMLLEKARDGLLSRHELDQVVAALRDPAGNADSYTLLHIIGRAMDLSKEGCVASYLDCPADPMLSRLALQVLCNYWGLAPKYLTEVRRFLSGVDWDVDGDVRQMAASIAGEVLRTTWHYDLFRSLLDISTNQSDLPEIRVAAIRALARAMGYDWDDMAPINSDASLDDEWYRHTLEQAFERYFDMS